MEGKTANACVSESAENYISAKISETYMDMLCMFDELNEFAQTRVLQYIQKLISQNQTTYR